MPDVLTNITRAVRYAHIDTSQLMTSKRELLLVVEDRRNERCIRDSRLKRSYDNVELRLSDCPRDSNDEICRS